MICSAFRQKCKNSKLSDYTPPLIYWVYTVKYKKRAYLSFIKKTKFHLWILYIQKPLKNIWIIGGLQKKIEIS